jgi:hypothetical protein
MVSTLQGDIARSPALRGYRFSILSGDTGRFATKSRPPSSGLVAQRLWWIEVAEIEKNFCKEERRNEAGSNKEC